MSSIKRASLDQIREMRDAEHVHTDAVPKAGEILDAYFWADAERVEPRSPRSVHLKLEPEVFDYFKSRGKGHLTRMQDVLKAYVRAHTRSP